ncbi:hypothetical protein GCM10007938_20130 [Vibrio zhanjiangensis]|uniref:3'-phosphate/5'-hydroxy nucleic acid ligase n=1 Tax=Vibrio zhanjiangensis TaxID=1046128 RepID=A0ABQ6EYF0_9VIBR|nr:hypothetical protein [Vibrio zhanjiangensis]GLT18235.1 hypothetical protein GCM10007938_20130 [Vibrio zhanjiangensis]
MVKGEFCRVEGCRPSVRMQEYVEQMNHITDMNSVLDNVIKAVPFFQIFAGRDAY